MSEKIRKSDIFEGNPFLDVKNTIDSSLKSIAMYDIELKKLSKSYKEISINATSTSTDLAKLVEIEKKSNATSKESERIKKTQLQLEKQLETARLGEIRLNQAREKSIDSYNAKLDKENKSRAAQQARDEKALIRQKKLDADKNNAYKQLTSNTQRLKDESKKLGAELLNLERSGRKNTKAYKDLSSQYRDVTRAAQQGDTQLKKLDATVGDNQRKVGNYQNALRGLNSTLGTLGIAFGAGFIARETLGVLVDFDEGLADIQKTTGLTKVEVRGLMDELLELDTRTSVGALQELTTAAGRLGIEGKANILDFVQSADMVFVALGDDLGGTADEIATSLGRIASAFGDERELGIGKALLKTGSIMNELSANSKATAGEILDFTNRMAGVASVSGIAQEEIQALGALFASSGQSIEVASTTLNKLLPELAANQEHYADVAGLTVDQFRLMLAENPIEALKSVAIGAQSSESGLLGLVETLGDFGVESARAASIVGVLATKTDEWGVLQGIAADASRELTSVTDEFNVKNNTLGASLEKLTKELQKVILGIDESGRVTGVFGSILQFLISNLGTIVGVLGKVVIAYAAYKAVQLSLLVVEKARGFSFVALGKSMMAQIPMTKAYSAAQKNLATQATASGEAVKSSGRAMSAIPWMIILTAGIEVAKMFYDIASGAKAARERSVAFDIYKQKSETQAAGRVSARAAELADEMQALERKFKLDIAASKNAQETARIETQLLKDKESALKRIEGQVKNDIKLANEKKAILIKQQAALNKVTKAGVNDDATASILSGAGLNPGDFSRDNTNTRSGEAIGSSFSTIELDKQLLKTDASISGINLRLTKYNEELKAIATNSQDASIEVEVNSIAIEDNTDKITASIPKIKERNVAFKETSLYLSRQVDLLREIAKLEEQSAIKVKESELEDLLMSNDTSIAQAKEIVDEINKIKSDGLLAQYEYELTLLEKKYSDEAAKELENLDNQKAELIAKSTKDDLLEIEQNYQKELDIIAANELKRAVDLATEKTLLEMNRVDDILELEKEREEKLNQINDDLLSRQVEVIDETNKEVTDGFKELAATLNNIQQEIINAYEKATDRKIEEAKRDEQLATDEINRLRDLANQGAILDEQSIADQERRRREAIKEQQRLEKQKQRMQFITLALQNVGNQIANGKTTGEALGSTIALQSAVKALFAGFDGFWKGTNNAPEGFAWVDEKGAEMHTDKSGNIKDFGQDGGPRLKWLDKGDKIIPHQSTMDILSNKLPNVQAQGVKVDPSIELLREQNRILKNAIESKITAEQLGSIIHVTTNDKKGNLSRVHLYKYRK